MQSVLLYEGQRNRKDYDNPEFLLQLSQHHVHQIETCKFNMFFWQLFLIPLRLVPDHSAKLQHLIQRLLFFITIWRSIGPATSPVHTNRKAYFYLIFCNLIFLYLIYITCFKYFLLDCGKAFLLYLVVADSMKVLFHKLHGTGNAV